MPASPRIVQAGRTDQRADFAVTVPFVRGPGPTAARPDVTEAGRILAIFRIILECEYTLKTFQFTQTINCLASVAFSQFTGKMASHSLAGLFEMADIKS
jgi:hypothetical protein